MTANNKPLKWNGILSFQWHLIRTFFTSIPVSFPKNVSIMICSRDIPSSTQPPRESIHHRAKSSLATSSGIQRFREFRSPGGYFFKTLHHQPFCDWFQSCLRISSLAKFTKQWAIYWVLKQSLLSIIASVSVMDFEVVCVCHQLVFTKQWVIESST